MSGYAISVFVPVEWLLEIVFRKVFDFFWHAPKTADSAT
jgi:hypothetical protein